MKPPKIDELSQRIESLSPAKRALLHARLSDKRSGQQIVSRESGLSELPLSFAQERIWLHEQLVPGSLVYLRPANVSIGGHLDISALHEAVNAIVARHESLRLRIKNRGDSPVLEIVPQLEITIPRIDLAQDPSKNLRTIELAAEELSRPIDVKQGPHLRGQLLRLGDEEHLLLLTFHHFIFDAWSQTVFLDELARDYESIVSARPTSPPRPQIQYLDFAKWDRSEQRLESFNSGREYWKQQLQSPPNLSLGSDETRVEDESEQAGSVHFTLPEALTCRLRNFAQAERTTLFSVLFSAYASLIHGLSGEDDLVVGCPVSGRTRLETESLIGVFINTLPLRVRRFDRRTFRELLLQNHKLVVEGLNHQDVPLQFIVQDVLEGRRFSSSPLFQMMYVHERLPMESRVGAGVTFAPSPSDRPATMVDLTLEIEESPARVQGHFVFRSRLWSSTTIENWTNLFLSFLHTISSDPEIELKELLSGCVEERRSRSSKNVREEKHRESYEQFSTSKDRPQFVPPRTSIEEQLASIWQDVLEIEQVGIHDHFFALGGHSLLATRVIVRIGSLFDVELPVRCLFDSPTIAELVNAIEERRGASSKRKMPELRQLERSEDTPLPLSFAQQRLWFLEQLEGELVTYNMPFAYRINGELNVDALRRAFETIVSRHEPLRTTFQVSDGEPHQVIGKCSRFDLPTLDFSWCHSEEQAVEISNAIHEESARRFDLTRDLMLRASLLHLSETSHVLLVTLHHIAADGWSMSILWQELQQLYAAYSSGRSISLPELAIKYSDYAAWQRAGLQGEKLDRLLTYWRKQLAGAEPLELPSDRPRPVVPTYDGRRFDFQLDSGLLARLKELNVSEGVTLQMTLLAAYQILLSRYSGQDDVSVGTPVAGRENALLETQIGFFINMIVLRCDLSGNPTFREYLHLLRGVSLSAYDHQELPFEKLVEEIQHTRNLGRSPLIQAMFQVMTFPQRDLVLDELEITYLPLRNRKVRFDLEMHLWNLPQGIEGRLFYSSVLFDESTIERFLQHYVTLLEGIAANPDDRIGELQLMSADEQQKMLVDWNEPQDQSESEFTVHELFERQVSRTPDSIAVVSGNRQLTYRELNQKANQFARYLIDLGVESETLVGLCLERTIDLVVGILGILKAGGAYLPLDAADPDERLQFVLRDAEVSLVVTQASLFERVPELAQHVISLDRIEDELREHEASDLIHSNTSHDNLAYVMFTSGSTGKPKGVMVPHRGITRLVRNCNYAKLDQSTCVAHLASDAFDASTFELWAPLLNGGRCVMFPDRVPDPERLEQLIHDHKVNTLWLTSTLFNAIIDQRPQALAQINQLLTGGEALSVPHVCRALKLLPNTKLINGYGPTENTTFTCCWSIPKQFGNDSNSVPIGRPISGTTVYVLDRNLQPVPIGVPGELFIGGEGLARGYLNRPELTEEKFVPNPFTNAPNSRLYRSGDRCRWLDSGHLEYLGRNDDQVKLRGFRIELGEIESVLARHPAVAQTAVILREDRPGEKRLVAYFTSTDDSSVDRDPLRLHLKTQLPEHMVPTQFVRLEEFPLTSSGKIDRQDLPIPKEDCEVASEESRTPNTETEFKLLSLWREVLGIQNLGIDDNFFDLGGHSLLAFQLFSRIEQSFHRKLPISIIFQRATIAELAKELERSERSSGMASILPIQMDGDARPLYLMPSIGGEFLYAKSFLESLGNSIPVLGIQPAMSAEHLEYFKDFRRTAQCYLETMRSYQPDGPYSLAGFSYGAHVAYEIACQLMEMGESVDLLIAIDSGPGEIGLRKNWRTRSQWLQRVVANFPISMREEFRNFSARQFASRLAKKFRRSYRILRSRGNAAVEFNDIFNIGTFPTQNAELLTTVFHAVQNFSPSPYSGKMELIRAEAGAMFGGWRHDHGWGRFADEVEVYVVPGNHSTILNPPNSQILSKILLDLLSSRDR